MLRRSLFFPAAIPALQPIVHEMFVVRNSGKADVGKELETQREVIISMLLRLIQYHQVSCLIIANRACLE